MPLFSDYRVISDSGLFDAAYYRMTNPEIAALNIDPLVHYIEEGARSGRNPHPKFDAALYLRQCGHYGERPENPLLHFITVGAARGLLPWPQREDEAAAVTASPAADALDDIEIRAHCDDIRLGTDGQLLVTGWSIGPAAIDLIAVLLDGVEQGSAVLGIERPDVADHYPGAMTARTSGFSYHKRVAASATGEHLLVLRVRADGREAEFAFPLAAVPAAENPPVAPLPTGSGNDGDLKLFIDVPEMNGGSAAAPIRGDLEIVGWGLARAGVEAVEVAIDGGGAGTVSAYYGIRRPDVQSQHPDWEDALASGFTAVLPHRVLPRGRHQVRVTLRDKGGRTATANFRIDVEEVPRTSGPWSLRRTMPPAEIGLKSRILERSDRRPLFCLLMPLDAAAAAAPAAALERAQRTFASLCAQVYPEWRLLLLLAGRSGRAALQRLRRHIAKAFDDAAERIEIVQAEPQQPLAALLRDAREDATRPRLFGLIEAGDELGCDALIECALAASVSPDADFLYADERRIDPASGAVEAFFKPQWSPDLLLSANYIGRPFWIRGELLGRAAVTVGELPAYGAYDLILRATELAENVVHIPAVLSERPVDGCRDSTDLEMRALERAIARRGISGEVALGRAPGSYRLKRGPASRPLVSIVIPTRAAGGLIKTCIESLRAATAYRNFEIVCVENIAPAERHWRRWLGRNADRVVACREPFNWSRFNNLAVAAAARGELLLFLNDDIEIIEPEWLDALVEHGERPEIGAVGPQLLYPDRRVQHAGMFLAATGQGRHAFRYAAADDPGYFGLALTQRNVIAVTGACLLTRRDTFEELGGFDEAHGIVNNDLDYCLKAWRSGRFNLYTPHARLIHHEAISRGSIADAYDDAAFNGKWRGLFSAGDPYFHPRLDRRRDGFSIDTEPVQVLSTGRGALARDDIRTILIVKLDHIGDCVIAFPAVRRLKTLFPHARLIVLASRGSRPVWSLEPSVDEVVEFDFFHARSSAGQVKLSDQDWLALQEHLGRYRFDLAIDLRKQPETRPVLQHAGARWVAGFDYRGRFPWLDLAVEWDGDQAYLRKRRHTADDLVGLVEAVAAACEPAGPVIAAPPPDLALPADLVRWRSPAKHLVCVHPAAGNDMKQWPSEHFAALIDRLATEQDAQVVVIGAPDDAELASGIVGQLQRPEAVWSAVGKLSLAELPGLLSACALFVGNDSGPKHIAAGLGVPTVGIHSGIVDVREWGPVGANAVAVARDVVCSPCYLTKLADCHRGLACVRQILPGEVYRVCAQLLVLSHRV